LTCAQSPLPKEKGQFSFGKVPENLWKTFGKVETKIVFLLGKVLENAIKVLLLAEHQHAAYQECISTDCFCMRQQLPSMYSMTVQSVNSSCTAVTDVQIG